MKSAVAEISRISESLPASKASQLLRFARALAASAKPKRKAAAMDGDAKWEQIINHPRSRPKLRAKIKEIDKLIAAGKTEPMDFSRL